VLCCSTVSNYTKSTARVVGAICLSVCLSVSLYFCKRVFLPDKSQSNNFGTHREQLIIWLWFWIETTPKITATERLAEGPSVLSIATALYQHSLDVATLYSELRKHRCAAEWSSRLQWCKQDEILKTKTKITRPRPSSWLPEVNKGTSRINLVSERHCWSPQ